jgi:hypothetical protein
MVAAGIQPPSGGTWVIRNATGIKTGILDRLAYLGHGLQGEELIGVLRLVEGQRDIQSHDPGAFQEKRKPFFFEKKNQKTFFC